MLGLENSGLEETLAVALDMSEGRFVKNDNFAGEKSVADAGKALDDKVLSWKSIQDQKIKTAQAAEIAGLIIQYADPRVKKLDRNRLRASDLKNTKAILEAA